MSITSAGFIGFTALVTMAYFLIPRKIRQYQWVLLLAASLCFYACAGLTGVIFILLTAISIYTAAICIEKISDKQNTYLKEHKVELSKEEREEYKKKNTRKKRLLLALALVFNFGMLCVFKYSHFVLESFNSLLSLFGGRTIENGFSLVMPIGISFYTFQSTGYLADVYWRKTPAQKNFGKMLLFISFFPQIIQGPISSYGQLSKQLFVAHNFSYDCLGRGTRRMIWGYFKKMVIADMLAPMVQSVFSNYNEYFGTAAFVGIMFYCIQIYADFSGYMDIVCGLCNIWGIELRENFDRPYFSKSVAEYWRRWHISLGDWFKTYMYYPLAVSSFAKKLSKIGGNGGKKSRLGKNLPATFALIIVWFTTGLWHGASFAYLIWGGLNGLFIIVSFWLEPFYDKINVELHLHDSNKIWRLFRILRTFLLVAFIKVLPEVGTLSQGIGLWGRVFTGGADFSFNGLFPYGVLPVQLIVILFGTMMMFVLDLIKYRKTPDEFLDSVPALIRFSLYFVLIALIIIFGSYGTGFTTHDFLYFKY